MPGWLPSWIRYVNSPHGAERTIICLNALAQIVSEILPKNGFSRFLLWFSYKMFHSLECLDYRDANGFKWKLMILPTIAHGVFVDFLFCSRENGAQSRHCRLKNRIFPFPGKPGFESGIFRDAIVPSHEELKRAKFHRAALSRLACRPWTNKQTNKPGGAEDLSCLRRLGTRNHVPKRWETSFARLRRNEFIFTHESTRNFSRANGSMSASRSALISKFEGCQREILNR